MLRSASGASAAEFALVMPLLILLLLGIIQYGMMFFVYNNMSNAAREAARAWAVGEVNEVQAEALAEAYLIGWVQDDAIVEGDTTSQSGINFARIRIRLPGTKAGVVQYAPGPDQLSATVLMRIE